MEIERIKINGIPAILYGSNSDKLYLFVHGKMSNKEEAAEFAKIATERGFQVLSFDLPEHGDRKDEKYLCTVQNGVNDLSVIGSYIQKYWKNISLYACSLGAYFSLIAYENMNFDHCLFVSPILDMERLIKNMMKWSNVDENLLKEKREIPTAFGEVLSWDYFCYVKEHPIDKWKNPTSILYGSADNLTERFVLDQFANRFNCDVEILDGGEHYFHTKDQIDVQKKWIVKCLSIQ